MIEKLKSFFVKNDGYSIEEVVVKALYRQRKSLHVMLRIVAAFELGLMLYGFLFFGKEMLKYIALYFVLFLASVISDYLMVSAEKLNIEDSFRRLKGFAYAYYIIIVCWGLAITTLDKLNGGTYWVAATILIATASYIKLNPIFQCVFTLASTAYLSGVYVLKDGEGGLGVINVVFFGGLICFIIIKDYKSIYNNFYLEKKLTDMSLRDGLTSVFNRRALEKFILSNKTEKVQSVSIIDIDDYSESSEGYSRKAMDDAILLVAVYLREQFSDEEIYRYGGDEFLILSECVSEETLDKLEKINFRLDTSERDFKFHIYGGISPVSGKFDVAECIECADSALFLAKKSGTKHFAIEK